MNTPCIAVVDDDPALLDMTELLLALEGYHVASFLTAADAVAFVATLQPALVIVDLHLERPAAGLEVVTALRQDAATAQIPILLWSADPDVEMIVARQHLDDVVVRVKPVLPEDLLRVVAELAPAARSALPTSSRSDVGGR